MIRSACCWSIYLTGVCSKSEISLVQTHDQKARRLAQIGFLPRFIWRRGTGKAWTALWWNLGGVGFTTALAGAAQLSNYRLQLLVNNICIKRTVTHSYITEGVRTLGYPPCRWADSWGCLDEGCPKGGRWCWASPGFLRRSRILLHPERYNFNGITGQQM